MVKITFALIFALFYSSPLKGQNEILNEKTRDYDQLHISLEITPDIPAAKITGKAAYKIVPLADNFSVIRFHSLSTKVNRVSVGKVNLSHRTENGILFIELPGKFSRRDTLEFEIEYTSKPARGIYFFAPSEKFPSKPLQAWTQGQGENNRHWYPAYDLPDDKLTSELRMTVSKELKVIGIGELLSIENKGDYSTYNWKMKDPHPNYLNCFIVGKFSTLKESFMDVSLEYHVPEKYFSTIDLYFGKTPKMLGFFSDFIVPYPYSRYAQTTVWDFEYGGMENITSTTMNQRMIHDEFAWPNYSAEGLVAHELAHQWFGDLLTCYTWDHIWLNEGFATYFDNLWEEYEHDKAHYIWAMNGSQGGARSESDRDTSFYSDSLIIKKIPAELSGGRAYSRGASILHMMRGKLGDEKFRKGIKEYTRKYAHKSVVTDNFKVEMEKASGISLTNFFNEWVYSPGYAVFSINHRYNRKDKTLLIDVSQRSSHKNGPGFYNIGLPARVYAGKQIIDTLLQLNGKENSFTIPAEDSVDLVVYNRFAHLLCRIEIDYSYDELVYMLRYEDDNVSKLYALGKLKSHGEKIVPELAASFKREKFFGIKVNLIEQLAQFRDALAEEIIAGALNEPDARVREAAAMALEKVSTPQVIKIIDQALKSEKNYYVRAALYYSSFAHNKNSLRDRFLTALSENSHMDINRRRAYEYAKNYKDPVGLEFASKYLDYNAGSGDNRLGDAAILDYAAVMFDTHRDSVIKIIENGLENYYFRTRNYAADLAARFRLVELKPKIESLLTEEQRIVVINPLKSAKKALE